jgi:polysaccharide export outer membrane protein
LLFFRLVFGICLLVLPLLGCSDLQGKDVIEQAKPGGQVAFDVVKINDAVLATVLARPTAPFEARFKKYVPSPDLKIAVGDMVSVVIWEASADGLFGNSLSELEVPAGASAGALTSSASLLKGVPVAPPGLSVSPDLMAVLFGGGGNGQAAAANGNASQTGDRSNDQQLRPGNSLSSNGTEGDAQSRKSGAGEQRTQQIEKLLDQATQSGRPGTRIPDQQVGPDGGISIPYAGRIKVADRTPNEVERTIETALDTKALQPQVLVVVKSSIANSVTVAGEMIGGKRVPLSPGGDRLMQVIAAAGGAHAPVHDTFVRLSRGGVTATIPLATLVADPSQDIFAEPGDILTLVRRPQTFSVFGATGKNTAITFNSDRLSLSEALAKAGGLLDERADPRAVFLFRYEPVSLVHALGEPVASDAPQGLSPVVYRLDLNEAKSYLLAQRFPVHDKDVVFVANAEIQPIYRIFTALSQIAGPVETGLITCHYSSNC